MSERFFRLIVGTFLLGSLYFEFQGGIIFLIGLLTVEGITNCRVPGLVTRLRRAGAEEFRDSSELIPEISRPRIAFDAERAAEGLRIRHIFALATGHAAPAIADRPAVAGIER